MKRPLIVILGPTGAGKSNLGVILAKKFNGAVLSADSRQIYRGLDVGSNKITKDEMSGVLHVGIDCADPGNPWTVSDYQKHAQGEIETFYSRGLLPFVVGGSALYIDSVVCNSRFPEVPPNKELRARLERSTAKELFDELSEKDPIRAESIDPHNKVRLVRALEIVETLGSVPFIEKTEAYDVLWVGLDIPDDELKEQLCKRFIERKDRIVSEIKKLLSENVDPSWLSSLGIEYRHGTHYVLGQINEQEFTDLVLRDSWKLVRKQRIWWKRNSAIRWYHPKEYVQIENDVRLWYSNRHS